MGCLIPIVALFFPRVVMVCIFLFTGWFGRAYDSVIWPLLGFVFMPFSTLTYMGAMLNNGHQLNGWWLFLFIICVFVDLFSDASTAFDDE